jgi:hypothetical protein
MVGAKGSERVKSEERTHPLQETKSQRVGHPKSSHCFKGVPPADLTHIGYHAAERTALEHRAICTVRSERECQVCQRWAERLRGELWEALMGNKSQIDHGLLEEKGRYGFH